MTAARLSSPFGFSTKRRLAGLVWRRARATVASSFETVSVKTIRRCSMPAARLSSVCDETTFHAPRATAMPRSRIARVSENLTPMLLQHCDETLVLPQRIPDGIYLHVGDRHLRRARQQPIQRLDCLLAFAYRRVNFREPLRTDWAVTSVH